MEKLNQIKLRKQLIKNDAILLIKWLKDDEVVLYLNEDKGTIDILNKILLNRQDVLLTYYLNQSNDFYMIDYDTIPIGFVSLKPRLNNTLEIVIAIGEKSQWGKKIGHHCIEEIIKMSKMNNTKLIAKIHCENIRSQNLFKHLKFKKIDTINKYYLYEFDE